MEALDIVGNSGGVVDVLATFLLRDGSGNIDDPYYLLQRQIGRPYFCCGRAPKTAESYPMPWQP